MSRFWPKEGLLTMMTRDTSHPHSQPAEPGDAVPCSTISPSLVVPASMPVDQQTILKHLSEMVEAERRHAANNLARAVCDLVLPSLVGLKSELNPQQQMRMDAVMSTLEHLISPFIGRLHGDLAPLTPAELRICNLIRQGMGTKQIALIEGVSPSTVGTHRRNIRRKLGLAHTKSNLARYLNSHAPE